MEIERLELGALRTNCYLVYDAGSRDCVVIDPGYDSDVVRSLVRELELKPRVILLTHGHYDHVGGAAGLQHDYDLQIFIHEQDEDLLLEASKQSVEHGFNPLTLPAQHSLYTDEQIFKVGESELVCRHLPGHSPGSIALVGRDRVFSGDTLFKMGIGRTDLPGGSYEQIVDSIRQKLFVLPDTIRVYPGHGPDTTIGEEKQLNPFVGC